MAFINISGTGASRPTYFEAYAAARLVPSIKAAILYSLSVRAPAPPRCPRPPPARPRGRASGGEASPAATLTAAAACLLRALLPRARRALRGANAPPGPPALTPCRCRRAPQTHDAGAGDAPAVAAPRAGL